jgi:hypothetical protein
MAIIPRCGSSTVPNATKTQNSPFTVCFLYFEVNLKKKKKRIGAKRIKTKWIWYRDLAQGLTDRAWESIYIDSLIMFF